jgi:hypothetical protein
VNQLPGDKNPLSEGKFVDHLMTEPPAPIDALKSFGSRFMGFAANFAALPTTRLLTSYPKHARDE